MEKVKSKLYKKWWFWLCIVLIVCVITIVVVLINNNSISNTKTTSSKSIEEEIKTAKQKTEEAIQEEKEASEGKIVNTSNANLDKKVMIGEITYSIDSTWKSEEDLSENVTYKYYYPTANTMLMVMFETGDNYGDSSNIDSFLDGYVSGMNLSDNDFISKSIKKINNYNCGIVKCYLNQYETIQYIIPNNNELYVFSFAQKDKLNDKYADLMKNIIETVEITQENISKNQANNITTESSETTSLEELTKEEETKTTQKADKIVEQLNKDFKLDSMYISDDLYCANYSYSQMRLCIQYDKNYELNSIRLLSLSKTTSTDYDNIAIKLANLVELDFTTNQYVDAIATIQCIDHIVVEDFSSTEIGDYKISSSTGSYASILITKK